MKKSNFALSILVASLGFLFTLNIVNPDTLIARQNLARYQNTGRVDARYLARLSTDAVSALVPAVADMRGENRETVYRALRWRQWQLSREDAPWTSFNLGRWGARRALDQPEWQIICPPLELRS